MISLFFCFVCLIVRLSSKRSRWADVNSQASQLYALVHREVSVLGCHFTPVTCPQSQPLKVLVPSSSTSFQICKILIGQLHRHISRPSLGGVVSFCPETTMNYYPASPPSPFEDMILPSDEKEGEKKKKKLDREQKQPQNT